MNEPDEPTFQTQTQHLHGPSDSDRLGTLGTPSQFTEPTLTGAGLRDVRIKGYRITGEIARGGMGVVLAARELELDREVAIKVMLDARRSPSAVLRFVREAKITARLAHPGIPPVHAMGLLDDGSPYLSMKLVHGKTLSQLLKDRTSPAEELPRFVRIFEQIAESVGYAHSMGVIHRDLKPANVMVGEFGEVQVMDWGIAKLANGSDSPESPQENSRFDGQTEAGEVIGTPAYLAPEQARGEKVDPRADVFALGAILSVILTGKSPFADGTSSEEVIRRSASGDLSAAMQRLDGCNLEPELVALAKKCLSPNTIDRPAHGREVAEAIAKYRADGDQRLQDAEKRRAAAEAMAIEQRKRRMVMMIAGAAVVVALSIGTLISVNQANRAGRAEQSTREQLLETQIAQQKAEKAGDQAKELYQVAFGAFDSMIYAIQNKLASRPGTLDIRKELLSNARIGLKKLLAEAEKQSNPDRLLIGSHFQMGLIETTLGNNNEAKVEFQSALNLARKRLEANPNDLLALSDVGTALAHLGDHAKDRNQVDQAGEYYREKYDIDLKLTSMEPNDPRWQRMLGQTYRRLGEVALFQNRVGDAKDYYQKRLDIFNAIAKANPDDRSVSRDIAIGYELLGDASGYQQKPQEALDHYLKANRLFKELFDQEPNDIGKQRDYSVSLTKLGNLHEDVGQLDQALRYYEEVTPILRMIVAADPQNFKAKVDLYVTYSNLASALAMRDDFEKAIEYAKLARDMIKPLKDQKRLVGQFANALENTERQIASCEKFIRARSELPFILSEPPNLASELLEYRIRFLIKAKNLTLAVESAEAFDKLPIKQPKIATQAAAQWCSIGAIAINDAVMRERCATKAIGLLKGVLDRPKAPVKPDALLAEIRKQPAIEWLKSRDDGKAFLNSLNKS